MIDGDLSARSFVLTVEQLRRAGRASERTPAPPYVGTRAVAARRVNKIGLVSGQSGDEPPLRRADPGER